MDNIHLWQYIVIAGPAAVLGGLAVWMVNREYISGLENVVLNKVSMAYIPYRAGKSHSAFLTFKAACETGQRVLYRGPGYVVMPTAMYEELTIARNRTVGASLAIMDDCPGYFVPDGIPQCKGSKVEFDTDKLFNNPEYAKALASYLMKSPPKTGGPL